MRQRETKRQFGLKSEPPQRLKAVRQKRRSEAFITLTSNFNKFKKQSQGIKMSLLFGSALQFGDFR